MLASSLAAVVLNPAFPAAVAVLVYAVFVAPKPVPRGLSRVLVVGLAVSAISGLAVGVYKSYAVPRDVLQDVVAAREYLAGRPMHPADMNELAREALAEESSRGSLLARWPAAAEREREQRDAAIREHWVQAHPPLMTLAVAPLVLAFGVLGTQAAMAILSGVALGITLWLIRRELWPDARGAAPLVFVLAVTGWAPVVAVFRLQQPGLILVGLLTLAWACLRRGGDRVAGAAVAVAAGLKLFPGLLAIPLVVRHRPAGVAVVVTSLLLAVGIFTLVPLSDVRGYRATVAGVVDEYATYPSMISLLGVYARWGRAAGLAPGVTKILWLVTVASVLAAWGGLLFRRAPVGTDPRREVDFEFAVGMSLIPWLSPIAWDHYQVFLLLPLALLGGRVLRTTATGPRVLFAALLVAVTLPDAVFLAGFDFCRRAGLSSLQVWVLEPLRAFVGVFLTAWLVRLWMTRSDSALTVPRGEAKREERVISPGVAA